jgi:DNA (cytosine-5)-methyltransferase 1
MSKLIKQDRVAIPDTGRRMKLDLGLGPTDEISVELFAGAGGISAGAKMIGFKFDIAINHNPVALAIHKANFPDTIQMINDVFEYHPLMVTRGAYVKHLHMSPDCTYHSRAKGKKKVLKRHVICGDHCSVDHTQLTQNTAERIRGLGWVGVGWAMSVRPRRITLENVSEFQQWGPTIEDKDGDIVPDPERAGQTFEAFKAVLTTGITKDHPTLPEIRRFLKPFLGPDYDEQKLINGLGYDIQFMERTASNAGAPTKRTRLYMMARCDGIPIKWRGPKYGDPDTDAVKNGALKPWRPVGDCIDWSIPAPSIFETKEEIKEKLGVNVRRPLAQNTLKRISKGAIKYAFETDKPYIVKVNHSYDSFRGQDVDSPIQTITNKHGYALATPYIVKNMHNNIPTSAQRPLPVILTGNHHYLCIPFITGIDNKSSAASVWSYASPLTTIVTEKRHAITAIYVMNQKGTDHKRMPIGNSAFDPATTITQNDTHALVTVEGFIQHHYGMSIGQSPYDPASAIASQNKHSIIATHCIKMKGTNLGYPCDGPAQVITSGGLHHGIVTAHMMKFYGTNVTGQGVDEPAHVITAKERFSLIAESLMHPPMTEEQRYKAWMIARMVEEYADVPVPFIGAVPLPRRRYVTTRFGAIVYDIGMRMLTERELYTAQGFPTDFIFDPMVEVIDKKGNVKLRPVTKSEAVAACGNSVPPQEGADLIGAMEDMEKAYPDLLQKYFRLREQGNNVV